MSTRGSYLVNNRQNVVKERPLMQCILNDTIESSKVEMFLCKLKSSFSVSWEIGKSAPGDFARLVFHMFVVIILALKNCPFQKPRIITA